MLKNPDENQRLYRSDKMVDTMPGLSRFQQATLHQARIEHYLIEYVRKYSNIEVEYGIMLESLSIDPDMVEGEGYPVSVVLRSRPRSDQKALAPADNASMDVPNGLYRSNLTTDATDALLQDAQTAQDTSTETVLAKYVVGCDGAHSWTRRQIGSVMEGDHTDFICAIRNKVNVGTQPTSDTVVQSTQHPEA
ncbi:hypothetical protein ACHAP5_011459 [Fusarium lateritium]